MRRMVDDVERRHLEKAADTAMRGELDGKRSQQKERKFRPRDYNK